jgi:hypothetical protein
MASAGAGREGGRRIQMEVEVEVECDEVWGGGDSTRRNSRGGLDWLDDDDDEQDKDRAERGREREREIESGHCRIWAVDKAARCECGFWELALIAALVVGSIVQVGWVPSRPLGVSNTSSQAAAAAAATGSTPVGSQPPPASRTSDCSEQRAQHRSGHNTIDRLPLASVCRLSSTMDPVSRVLEAAHDKHHRGCSRVSPAHGRNFGCKPPAQAQHGVETYPSPPATSVFPAVVDSQEPDGLQGAADLANVCSSPAVGTEPQRSVPNELVQLDPPTWYHNLELVSPAPSPVEINKHALLGQVL